MTDRSAAAGHSLAGVRLGALERTLLMSAPPLYAWGGGLLIDAPEGTRSAQQGYLRAAKKLERHGLVRHDRVAAATRAYDPRRDRPLYRRGRFWIRSDSSRRHLVRRVVIWATPFGEGIRRVYERELTSGKPIRWSREKIERARRFERQQWRNPDEHKRAREELEARLGEERERPRVRLREVYPEGMTTPAASARWHDCIVVARREHPKVGDARLWEIASELLDSDTSTESLRSSAKAARRRAPDRPPLRFIRTELGQLLPTGRASATGSEERG